MHRDKCESAGCSVSELLQKENSIKWMCQNSGAVWKSRWPSWAFRPNKPYGFCGRKATIKPCLGIGHSFSLICQPTSEDMKLYIIIHECVSRFGLVVRRWAGKQRNLGSNPPWLSFLFESWHCLLTMSFTINGTLKWLSSLPILMQESFWWWQCSDIGILSPPPPPTHTLISPPPHLPIPNKPYVFCGR